MPLPKLGADAAIAKLPGWTKVSGARDAITRTFKFKDFNAAFGFMTRAALWPTSTTTIPNGPTSTTRWR